MIARYLALLGLSVSLALVTPVASYAQSKPTAEKTATVKKPVKKPVKKAAKAKKPSKAVAKAKKPGKSEKVAEEKPKGLFASLFGPKEPVEGKKPVAKKATSAKVVAKPTPKKVVDAGAVKPADATKANSTPMFFGLFGAKPQAEPVTVAEPKRAVTETGKMKPLPVVPVALGPEEIEVVSNGNNGELRSEDPSGGVAMASLFGREDVLLPQTRALDRAQAQRDASKKKKFAVASQWQPQDVEFSGYPAGTIVIDTDNHFLYLVQSGSTARRYGIAVGKDGLKFKGSVKVGDKQEWPRWIPTKDMQEREPKKYGKYKDGMPGGGMNPLGARAIYLYQGNKDTHLRIHGTIAPQTIGTDSSNGCFRMVNDHVMDLYRRVRVGTNVVVL